MFQGEVLLITGEPDHSATLSCATFLHSGVAKFGSSAATRRSRMISAGSIAATS